MNERLIHLRIKIKSLADESRTIRSEAKKLSGMEKWSLDHHRKTVVRSHTRSNLLAYGLLRGIPYRVMEKRCNEPPSFYHIEKHAATFGGTEQEIRAWIEDAAAHLSGEEKAA